MKPTSFLTSILGNSLAETRADVLRIIFAGGGRQKASAYDAKNAGNRRNTEIRLFAMEASDWRAGTNQAAGVTGASSGIGTVAEEPGP